MKKFIITLSFLYFAIINFSISYAVPVYDGLTDIQEKVSHVTKEVEMVNEEYSKAKAFANQVKTGVEGAVAEGRKAYAAVNAAVDEAKSTIAATTDAVNSAKSFKDDKLNELNSSIEKGGSFYQGITANTSSYKVGSKNTSIKDNKNGDNSSEGDSSGSGSDSNNDNDDDKSNSDDSAAKASKDKKDLAKEEEIVAAEKFSEIEQEEQERAEKELQGAAKESKDMSSKIGRAHV